MKPRTRDNLQRPAVGYIRCSTSGQVVDGVSLQTQRAAIEASAVSKSLRLHEVFEDAGISGASLAKRQGLQDALTTATKLKAPLIVYSLSRLARSTRDALEISDRLDRAGADLVSLTESIDTTSASGKMVFRMLAVLAEFERDTISERTRAAMAYKRAQGKRVSGHVPFGFKLSGSKLVRSATEQTILGKIQRQHARGRSLRQICRYLTRKGVRPKAGGRAWYPSTIRNILARADM